MSSVPPMKPLPVDQGPRPVKSGCTPASLLLLGCAGVMLVGVLLCGGFGVYGYRWAINQIDQFAEEHEKKGYERQAGQVIEVNESPSTNTVYVCQVLKIQSEVDVDLAIMSQVAEIHADIHGDVEFFGQVLQVDKGVKIEGDLFVKNAQLVEINGEVTGKITGNYQQLKYGGKRYSSGKSPTDEKESAESQGAPATTPATPAPPEAPVPAEAPVPPTAEAPSPP
jgi:hypothetical protein